MGALFSSPKQPKLPPPIDESKAAQKAVSEEAKKARKRKGRLSTILTQQTSEGTLLGG